MNDPQNTTSEMQEALLEGNRIHEHSDSFYVRAWQLEYVKYNPQATPAEIRRATYEAIDNGKIVCNGK